MRRRNILWPLASFVSGCATPMPVMVDFSEIKAEVRVPFDSLAGPSFERARESAEPVAAQHCRSMGKRTVYVSGRDESEYAGTVGGETRINIYETEYVFLYRCEGEAPSTHGASFL